jgi:hypothetical protein
MGGTTYRERKPRKKISLPKMSSTNNPPRMSVGRSHMASQQRQRQARRESRLRGLHVQRSFTFKTQEEVERTSFNIDQLDPTGANIPDVESRLQHAVDTLMAIVPQVDAVSNIVNGLYKLKGGRPGHLLQFDGDTIKLALRCLVAAQRSDSSSLSEAVSTATTAKIVAEDELTNESE